MKYNSLICPVFLLITIFLSQFCLAQNDLFWQKAISKQEVLSDFDTCYSKIIKKHVNPFWKMTPAMFEKEYTSLRKKIETLPQTRLTIEDAMIYFQQLVSNTGDIHINSFQLRGRPNCRFFPVYLQRYNTKTGYEFRVMITDSANADLLESRISHINGHPVKEIEKKLSRILPKDFEQSRYYLTRLALKNGNILHGLGIIESTGQTAITFVRPDDHVITRNINSYYSSEARKLTLKYYDDLLKEIPLTNQKRDLYYWYKYIPEKNAVYFRYSAVANNDNDITAAFSKRLFSFIDSVKADRLIIDIRDNGGGDGFKNVPILAGIEKSRVNRPGQLFCLVNGLTFSAAVIFLHQLDGKTNALIVGEPPGDAPNFCSDFNVDTLPNTQLPIALSTLEFLNSFEYDKRKTYEPEVMITDFTWKEYISNTDRMLDYTLTTTIKKDDGSGYKPVQIPEGKYDYNAVKPAFISKINGQLYFQIPGEITTSLYPTKTPTKFTTDIKDLQIEYKPNELIMLNRGVIVRRLKKMNDEELKPYEMVSKTPPDEVFAAYKKAQTEDPGLLCLADINMSLDAYRIFFSTGDLEKTNAILDLNKKLNPSGIFADFTKDAIKKVTAFLK